MITDVPGVRVGHWTDLRGLTGCTVILPPPASTGSVAVLGGAPATRETDALAPGTLVNEVHAVVLTGGSAFGLSAADGVVRVLEGEGIGFDTGVSRVPIVPAAALFDLGIGDAAARPGPAEGEAACLAATATERSEGNVGAGAGATVGMRAGPLHRMKGGLGGASRRQGELVVGAIAAVNAWGDVLDEEGRVLAGARAEGAVPGFPNTTLVCIATNARLTKEEVREAARAAAAGIARAVRPAFTIFDGDVVFALATNSSLFPVDLVGTLASDAIAEAIRRGVRAAASVDGAPAVSDGGER
jgi:L-aminopeptidase/D-esterase-like protein